MNPPKIIYGFALSVLYVLFIMLLPHRTFRVQGIESDLGYYYVPMARELATKYFGEEAYTPREYTWEFHGPVYPLMLLLGRKTLGPKGDWGYFVIAKWISALAGGSLILLAVIGLGMPAGILAALSLGLTSLFTECAFSCGTDLVSVALVFWSAFLLQTQKVRRFGVVAAGLLYAFAVDMRHEYIVLLPFAAALLWMRTKGENGYPWYHIKQRLSPIWFFLPYLLVVVPNMPRWNGTYNAAFKYKADDARWQDLWPEEAFTDVETDTLKVSYWGYLIHEIPVAGGGDAGRSAGQPQDLDARYFSGIEGYSGGVDAALSPHRVRAFHRAKKNRWSKMDLRENRRRRGALSLLYDHHLRSLRRQVLSIGDHRSDAGGIVGVFQVDPDRRARCLGAFDHTALSLPGRSADSGSDHPQYPLQR
jgi:hypothetical protein